MTPYLVDERPSCYREVLQRAFYSVPSTADLYTSKHSRRVLLRSAWREQVVGDRCGAPNCINRPNRPSYLVGLGGFEPPTSPLSGVRSNQLSYRPRVLIINQQQTIRVGTTQSEESGMDLIFPTRWG